MDKNPTYWRAQVSVFPCPEKKVDNMLHNLVISQRERSPKVISNVISVSALNWGSREAITKERSLLDPFTQPDIVLANETDVNTFHRRKCGSIADLTFVSPAVARDMLYP